MGAVSGRAGLGAREVRDAGVRESAWQRGAVALAVATRDGAPILPEARDSDFARGALFCRILMESDEA